MVEYDPSISQKLPFYDDGFVDSKELGNVGRESMEE